MPERKESLGNQLAEVWNDTVKIRDLAVATVLGILFGMTFFLVAEYALARFQWGGPDQQKGYALLFGILGCLLSGILSVHFFKAKRNVVPGTRVRFQDALLQLGVDPNEEIAAIRASSQENRNELAELGILEELDRWN